MTNDGSANVASAILEMADDLHRVGIMDGPTHEKITLRHFGKGALATAKPISGEEIPPGGGGSKPTSARGRSPAN